MNFYFTQAVDLLSNITDKKKQINKFGKAVVFSYNYRFILFFHNFGKLRAKLYLGCSI
jgi:hypothetical protein